MLLLLLLLLGVGSLVVHLGHVLGSLEGQDHVTHPRFLQELQGLLHTHVLRHEEALQ